MKTLKNKIRIISLCLALLLSSNVFSQERNNAKKLFVRVYDTQGKKIGKGYIVSLSDSLMELRGNGKRTQFKVRDIGTIKTKHSAGNNILIGTAVGATTGAIIGAASGESDPGWFGYTKGEGAAGFGLIGALGGAALGGISIAFKNSLSYPINGSTAKWEIFMDDVKGIKLE